MAKFLLAPIAVAVAALIGVFVFAAVCTENVIRVDDPGIT
jgi:hypothetical protein